MTYVISEERLLRFFSEMQLGFERDLGDLFVFFGSLGAFLCLYLFAWRLYLRRRSRARRAAVRNAFKAHVREKALRRNEIALLETLSRYLKPPFEKLSLFTCGAVFNACARSLLEEGGAPRELIARLRKKLGFRPSYAGGAPVISGDLPEGITLRILDRRSGRRTHGRLTRNDEAGLVVELDAPSGMLPGARVQVSFGNGFGVFVFPSVVRSLGAGTVTLSHAGTVSRVQRRAFFRRRLAGTAYVKAAGSREKPLRSTLVDLSGGGASLRRTGDIFRENGLIEIGFFISGESRIDLTARVIRLTHETAHVRFDGVPDHVRDRIIGYLFSFGEA